jgi:hypothetical protein
VYSLHIKNIRMAGDSKYDDWAVPINE